MKKLFLLGSLLLTGFSFGAAQKTHIIYARNAVLNLCSPHIAGCTDKVEIDGKAYMLDALHVSRTTLESVRNAYLFHHMNRTQPGIIAGFIVREPHMPNPMYQYDVFKALELEFPMPH